MADLERIDPAAVATGLFAPSGERTIASPDGATTSNKTLEIHQVTENGRLSIRASSTQTYTPTAATQPQTQPQVKPMAAVFMTIGAVLAVISVGSIVVGYAQSSTQTENRELKREIKALKNLNALQEKQLERAREVICE